MREDFLHFLWKFKRFAIDKLVTTNGEAVQIVNWGTHNLDAGPDFSNAKIRIGDTLWAGNVEMHLRSSEWKKHQHQNNPAYDSVILHVVLEEDALVYRNSGEQIPCLELKKHIPPRLSKTYLKIWNNAHWIPCQHLLHTVDDFTKSNWLDRVLVERLERKTKAIQNRLAFQSNDWEAVFYQFLARNFGVQVNSDPFELLAQSLPLPIIRKYKDHLFQLEALLFGQAGMLDATFTDDYPNRLKKEYDFLQQKHQLVPLKGDSWKFLRMRPANFPTIRIAQFARLIHQTEHLFSKALSVQALKEVEAMLDVKIMGYWETHYVWEKPSTKRRKSLGKNMIRLITINTIIPFLFLYGQEKKIDSYKEKAIQLLEALPAEKNNILSKWEELAFVIENAYQSQALLEQKKNYCNTKRCLECGIGAAILQ